MIQEVHMKYLGTKTLETERLLLRKVNIEDAKIAYKNWRCSNVVDKYVLWTKHESVEETTNLYKKWIEEYEDNKTFRWVVELKENHDLIGTIDVSKKFIAYGTCEIGYCYSDKYWNKGYATEALKEVMRFLFEQCEAELIYARFMENNPASGKVMEKAGLIYEGKERSRIIDKEGIRNDLINYSITRDEYLKKKI